MKNTIRTLSTLALSALALTCGMAHAEDSVAQQGAPAQRFAVQLGSFPDAASARDWVDRLNAAGVPAYTERRTQGDGSTRILLRAGPFFSRADASAAITKVREAGLTDGDSAQQGKQEPNRHAADNAAYVRGLRAKYADRIGYDGPESREAVRGFVIDCRYDGRRMPLENVLLADTAMYRGGIDFHVQHGKGGATRIIEAPHGADRGEVWAEIDQYGTLHSDFVEPIMNACALGTYGPIWEGGSQTHEARAAPRNTAATNDPD